MCVVANQRLGEFVVVKLGGGEGAAGAPPGPPIQYAPVRNCCGASRSLISCVPVKNSSSVLVAHLGEERCEFVITELCPPDAVDDFAEPTAVIARIKHSRLIDWLDFSPSG